MTSPGPELSSVATSLSELTSRVTTIAESLSGGERDDLATELFEAERSMVAASRRLERVLEQLT